LTRKINLRNSIFHVGLVTCVVLQQIIFRNEETIKEDQDEYLKYLILTIALTALVIILNVMLMCLMGTLKKKWRKTSEKNQLKNGIMFNFQKVIIFSYVKSGIV